MKGRWGAESSTPLCPTRRNGVFRFRHAGRLPCLSIDIEKIRKKPHRIVHAFRFNMPLCFVCVPRMKCIHDAGHASRINEKSK
ncbi:hypothetical protein Bcep18194_B1928 [Burkholderia lata]|uniref:Uncharacterized protein n=1 Tax=Burkholderia lata (strain ATCC 17760 / DSM 23089 / LMG 22485 / NCIMB 9086 / R18194 / 383) TaxID=482957 RepID=Q394S5_BURL3|nr:hypothetical protein Bcep18194_B1928 [Burkholderia lata]